MHFLIPGIIAYFFFKDNWKMVWLTFILTMFVDIDHLVASPIFDSNRCSINYHLLHSYYAIFLYFLLLIPSKTRIVGIGLLFHMLTDFTDCFWL
ncbi:hypothetical protein BX611_1798 [Lutibacter oceani]|uniref:LexA-binding, inner membrane-associated hydrolase n=2 Tax=Lutibacter oceani TaxID=1853311 RepID=A0A3D9S0N1_9FLAO|nr:hypothetical protein BX611_1798 [Lutibacter oceani]